MPRTRRKPIDSDFIPASAGCKLIEVWLYNFGATASVTYTEGDDSTDAVYEIGNLVSIQITPYAFPDLYCVNEYFYSEDGNLDGVLHLDSYGVFANAVRDAAKRYAELTK